MVIAHLSFSLTHTMILKISIWVFVAPIRLRAPGGQGPNAVFDVKTRLSAAAS